MKMHSNASSSGNIIFTGSIPSHYDEHLGPMFFEPYAIEVASRIALSSVQIALELACGTGRVTHHLRKVLPESAKLIASDISGDMLAIARENLEGPNIDWEILNLERLPFKDESIDLVVCCFGYMFATDKVKAFAEAHRVLIRGGVLLFTTWDKLENNAASFVYRTAAKKYLTEPLPDNFRLPFSMHNKEEIKNDLQEAGFNQMAVEYVKKISVSPNSRQAAVGLARGGSIYNEIMKINPAWVDEIENTVERKLAEKFGAAPVEAPMSALIIRAQK